jgi:tetraacyldisaccharide-1-P 4'-kinase
VVAERRAVSSPEALPPIDGTLLAVMPPGVPVYRSYLEAIGVRRIEDSEVVQPTRIIAFAAIANPAGFFDSLIEMGFTVEAQYEFPDHHSFTQRDLQDLLDHHPGLPMVCTSKDAVKIRLMDETIRQRCAALDVKLRVIPADAFAVQIIRRIRGKLTD